MIQMMANENLDLYGKMTPAVLNETVLVAKEFLDRELAKYESWEEAVAADKFISGLFDNPIPLDRFQQLKNKGVGRDTIQKFLGSKRN